MLDQDKSKEQLLAELEDARRRIRGLTASEIACRQAEEPLSQMAEFVLHNPAPVLRVAPDGRILRINPAAEKILGPGMAGTSAYGFLPALEKARPELMRPGAPLRMEVELDGGWFSFAAVQSNYDDSIFIFGNDITERQKSKEQFSLFFNMSLDMMCIADINTSTFTLVNPAFARALGYSEKELLGMPFLNFVHPDDLQPTLEVIGEKLRRGEEVIGFENRYRRADGSYVWLSWVSHPLPDKGLTFAVARDETERRQAFDELARTRDQLNTIFDNVPAAIWFKDDRNNILRANKTAAKLTGMDPAEIEGRPTQEVNTPEASKYYADDMEVLTSGRPKLGILEGITSRDGQLRWVSTDKLPVTDQDGKVTGVLVFATDITERKLAEEAFRESEARYRRLHESIRDAVARVDMDGVIVEHNKSFQEMLGYSEEEIPRLTYMDLTPPKWREAEARIVRDQVLVRGYSEVYEKEYRRRDGTVFPVELRTYLLRDPQGEPAGMWAIIRDISERKRLLEGMIQTEKMLGVGGLAAGMAHEINNPLGGIISGVQSALRRLEAGRDSNLQAAAQAGVDLEKLQDYLEQRNILTMMQGIRDAAVRAAHIVASMLEFSRKDTPTHILSDMAGLLKRSVELCSTDYDLKKNFDFRHILITTDYAPDLPMVPCSPNQMEQVFMNILRNAAQAMSGRKDTEPAPAITLRARVEEDSIRIDIEDNGPGMDDATRKRIFEPFFTTKPPGIGTGLGLSVSYYIVTNNHSGSITAEPIPGRGTRFVIRLPLNPPPASEAALAARPA